MRFNRRKRFAAELAQSPSQRDHTIILITVTLRMALLGTCCKPLLWPTPCSHARHRGASGAARATGHRSFAARRKLEHDPEKWIPVFGKDHAPTMRLSEMAIRRKVISL